MITFIFPSTEISPDRAREKERKTAQVAEGGGKHFVLHVSRHATGRGGWRRRRRRTWRDIMRMCGIDSFHLRVWSSSSSGWNRMELWRASEAVAERGSG